MNPSQTLCPRLRPTPSPLLAQSAARPTRAIRRIASTRLCPGHPSRRSPVLSSPSPTHFDPHTAFCLCPSHPQTHVHPTTSTPFTQPSFLPPLLSHRTAQFRGRTLASSSRVAEHYTRKRTKSVAPEAEHQRCPAEGKHASRFHAKVRNVHVRHANRRQRGSVLDHGAPCTCSLSFGFPLYVQLNSSF